ncbi:MAG: hypothetical protein ACLFPE_14910, partial [Bacteroidales bacterium]
MVKYVFYISDHDLESSWGRIAGDDGYATDWDESDNAYYEFDVKVANSSTGGNWSQAGSWHGGIIPDSSSADIEIVSSTNVMVLDQNAEVKYLNITSQGSLNGSSSKFGEILTVSDGGFFINSGTFSAGSGVVNFAGNALVSGAVAFNDVEISGGVDFGTSASVTGILNIKPGGFVNSNPPTYEENAILKYSTGGDYAVGAEWTSNHQSGQGVPFHVVIETSNPVRLSGDKFYHVRGDLVINAATEFALSTTSGGDLQIEGDFTDNGTLTHHSRLITFTGSSLQSIGGNSHTQFGYFAIAADAVVEIPSSKDVTVENDFSVAAAKDAKAAGILTVRSVEGETGSLITKSNVSGTVNIERYLTTGWDWHFLSSPVQDQNITDQFIDFSSGTGEAGVDFYRWGETVTGDNRWINIKNGDGTLNESFGSPSTDPEFEEGLGYLVAYADRAGLAKTFSGTPNTGNQTLTLTYTADGGQGWNLAGNPYPSAIDWTLLDKTNLAADYYYVYNQNKAGGAGYEFFKDASNKTDGVNGKIPAMQGFFVEAAPGGGSIGLTNDDRVHDTQPFLKNSIETDENLLKLKLSAGEYFYRAQFRLSENASVERDPNDA